MCIFMTTEFRDLQELYEKKRKNEQAVSEELLQTRYKKSYDQLCGNVKQKQCELRAAYMERMRVITGLMSESVYQDFGQEAAWGWLMDQVEDIYQKYPDPLTKKLLIGIQSTIEEMGKGD